MMGPGRAAAPAANAVPNSTLCDNYRSFRSFVDVLHRATRTDARGAAAAPVENSAPPYGGIGVGASANLDTGPPKAKVRS